MTVSIVEPWPLAFGADAFGMLCEDQGLANHLDIQPELSECVIVKGRVNLMTVSFLSVKNGQRTAISCGLVNTCKDFHLFTIMFDRFCFMLIEI